MNIKLIKKPEVLQLTAKSNTTLYSDIKLGLMTPPVPIGENSVAWPEHEINAINSARVAGKSKDELRTIVADLVKQRQEV